MSDYEKAYKRGYADGKADFEKSLSRIEKALHGKTPEEQYKIISWLRTEYGLDYNHSELARIAWLTGEDK